MGVEKVREDIFRDWLHRRGHQDRTIGARISNVRRVEQFIGDLDEALDNEGKESLLSKFAYSTEDERQQRPNPSPVPIDGDLRTGLATLRQAIGLYDDFRNDDFAMPDKIDHMAWVNRLTKAEILAVMDDCDAEGAEAFLKRVGFSKPQQWTKRQDDTQNHSIADPNLYPAKATVATAIAKLPDGPSLNARQYFNGFGEAQSRAKLRELGFEIVDMREGRAASRLTRDDVEKAMLAFDQYEKSGAHSRIFDAFADPSSYWVRSTSRAAERPYPTKPIVGYLLDKTSLNGGWSSGSAAASLHNAGYIIVDAESEPCDVPEHDHLLGDADRIRACARNYFIEPARDAGEKEVPIRASDLAKLMGLTNAFPNICQALEGRTFLEMIETAEPDITGPNPSSTTVFTYQLTDQDARSASPHTPVTGVAEPMAPTNLILYGPPGTGKTYATAAEALGLCGEPVPDNRGEVMAAYDQLRAEKRIEFVTFHQSMSYEDFIEGRQPTTEDDGEGGSGTGFRLETVPGIFRRIASRAESGISVQTGDDAISLSGRQVFKMSIGRANMASEEYLFEEAISEGHVLLGWEDIDFTDDRFSDVDEILQVCHEQGTREGDVTLQSGQVAMLDVFRNQMEIGDIVVATKGNGFFRAIGEVIGNYEYHQRDSRVYSHRRAVRWLWVDREGVPASEIYDGNFTMRSIYPLSPSRLNVATFERYMNSDSDSSQTEMLPFVLIIDEINRANISKVFGELITLIEPDKRTGMPNALKVRLPYSGEEFGVPANLHILGTMNTADRSIALLDTALRRRFEFREMMPEHDIKEMHDAAARCGLDLPRILTSLNERIEYLYDREHQIGHAYFINCTSREDVDAVMRHKVIPLLAEYFFEDWGKVAAVLGDAASHEGPIDGGFMIRIILKAPPGLDDVGDGAPRFRWSLRQDGFSYDGLTGQ